MPVYQDKKTKKWKFRTYADDVYVNRKQFERKGFNTKKEAQQAEIDFKMSDKYDKSKITFYDLWVEYRSSKELQLKAQSFRSVESRFKNHILPYFKDYNINKITNSVYLKWLLMVI